jgi:hypothetical protein
MAWYFVKHRNDLVSYFHMYMLNQALSLYFCDTVFPEVEILV